MACGCSVIGTAVPGIKQVILNNQTGLLVEEDVETLKSTIKLLLADKALQKELSKNASLYIKENNSLDNAITYEMTAYNKTIA